MGGGGPNVTRNLLLHTLFWLFIGPPKYLTDCDLAVLRKSMQSPSAVHVQIGRRAARLAQSQRCGCNKTNQILDEREKVMATKDIKDSSGNVIGLWDYDCD